MHFVESDLTYCEKLSVLQLSDKTIPASTINIRKQKKKLNSRHVYEKCLFALTHFATHSRERKSSCCCVCTHHVRYGDWHSCYTHTHRRPVIGEIRSKRSFDCRQDSKCHGRLCISLFHPVSTVLTSYSTGFGTMAILLSLRLNHTTNRPNYNTIHFN